MSVLSFTFTPSSVKRTRQPPLARCLYKFLAISSTPRLDYAFGAAHADEDFRRQALAEMAARARWESSRYWESARRFWARSVGDDTSKIRLPENVWELEEEFWGRVDAAIHEALEGRWAEANEE